LVRGVLLLGIALSGCSAFAVDPPCRSDDNCPAERPRCGEGGICEALAGVVDAGVLPPVDAGVVPPVDAGVDAGVAPPGPYCGDGVVVADAGEACDDGAQNGSYGSCATDCSRVRECGDYVVDPEESCDLGPSPDTVGNFPTCDGSCALADTATFTNCPADASPDAGTCAVACSGGDDCLTSCGPGVDCDVDGSGGGTGIVVVCDSTEICDVDCSAANSMAGCHVVCIDSACDLRCFSEDSSYPCSCDEVGAGTCSVRRVFD
jgi:hypothetical protein